MNNQHKGSSFDDFLAEHGFLEACEQTAKKRVSNHEKNKFTGILNMLDELLNTHDFNKNL